MLERKNYENVKYKFKFPFKIKKASIAIFDNFSEQEIREFIAHIIDEESKKFEKFSEPWEACVRVSSIFKGEYK